LKNAVGYAKTLTTYASKANKMYFSLLGIGDARSCVVKRLFSL